MQTSYKVLRGSLSESGMYNFEKNVNSLLRDGWDLHGGFVASNGICIQAFVKKTLTTSDLERILP